LAAPPAKLCKKLRNLGLPQVQSGWFWVWYENEEDWDLEFWDEVYLNVNDNSHEKELLGIKEVVRAPTIAELLEWLPDGIELDYYDETFVLSIVKDPFTFTADYVLDTPNGTQFFFKQEITDMKLPDALAKLLIKMECLQRGFGEEDDLPRIGWLCYWV